MSYEEIKAGSYVICRVNLQVERELSRDEIYKVKEVIKVGTGQESWTVNLEGVDRLPGTNYGFSYTRFELVSDNYMKGAKQAKEAVGNLAKSMAFFVTGDEYKGYKETIQRLVPSLKDQ